MPMLPMNKILDSASTCAVRLKPVPSSNATRLVSGNRTATLGCLVILGHAFVAKEYYTIERCRRQSDSSTTDHRSNNASTGSSRSWTSMPRIGSRGLFPLVNSWLALVLSILFVHGSFFELLHKSRFWMSGNTLNGLNLASG